MEDIELTNLWKLYDQKLEASLSLNKTNAKEITKLKVQSFLASMKPLKLFTLLIGIVWVGFVDMIIAGVWHVASPFFLASAGIQSVLTTLAIGIYIYQLILIHNTDSSEPIVATQEKIARLQTSTLWVTRLLFLQLPVWTTFYWNKSMLTNGNTGLFILQAIVTLSFVIAAVWLFINIKYENRNKKWFGFIFNGKEWNPLIKSMDLLSQVKEYEA